MKTRLLSSLLESYEYFTDTLFYGRQELTVKDVKEALSSKEITKKINGKVLIVRGRFEDKRSKYEPKDLKSFQC